MAFPYVYKCTHKVTKRFYIGYREANKVPATSDFGFYYFSSCPEVNSYFNEYTYEILGEFRDPKTAYEIEQSLISRNSKNPLLINEQWKGSVVDLTGKTLSGLKYHCTKYNSITNVPQLVKRRRKSKTSTTAICKKIWKKSDEDIQRERLGNHYLKSAERAETKSRENKRYIEILLEKLDKKYGKLD